MLKKIREEWRHFRDCEPGTRFERLHARKQQGGRGVSNRLFWWTAGLLLILAGIVMLFTPGPGLLSIAFGLACLAHQSLPIARRCDRAEVGLRARLARWRRRKAP